MKTCTVIGYNDYIQKETNEKFLRILVGIDPKSDKFKGLSVILVYLPYTEELKQDLDLSIDNGLMCEYTTTDNILTGKTKISTLKVIENIYE